MSFRVYLVMISSVCFPYNSISRQLTLLFTWTRLQTLAIVEALLYSPLNSAMTHHRRTIIPTEKVRQAKLDFTTPGNRTAKREWVNASATPARQALSTSSTPAQTRLSSPRALLLASQQGCQPLSKDDAFKLELREMQPEEALSTQWRCSLGLVLRGRLPSH